MPQLIVKPHSAKLDKGTDYFFIKKSPYIVIQVGNKSQQTKPDIKGG